MSWYAKETHSQTVTCVNNHVGSAVVSAKPGIGAAQLIAARWRYVGSGWLCSSCRSVH